MIESKINLKKLFQLGGWTSRWEVSQSNAFLYDYQTEAFQSAGLSLAHPAQQAYFTRVPDEAWIFRNCSIYKTIYP